MHVGESRRGGLTRYISKRVYAGGHALLRSTVVLRYIIINILYLVYKQQGDMSHIALPKGVQGRY